jgi:hypothetical protein
MAPYFLIFLLPACFALAAPTDAPKRDVGHIAFVFFAVLLALMIGFRWQVGGDFGNPVYRMTLLGDADLVDFLRYVDPGFGLLMWLEVKSGFNVWFVHLMGGGIFMYGLSRFCLNEFHPWLSMTIAIPYLVIVVGMGYDRQAVAIGFVMLAMVAMQDRSALRLVGSTTLAATMHITSLSLMPVFMVGTRVNKFWAAIVGGPIFAVGYFYSLQEKLNDSTASYLSSGYSSSGAGIRTAMNALPALIYFFNRSRFKLDDDERRFADFLAAAALAFVGLLFISPSSTAVDRMSLYIIPIQLFVLGRLPLALARTKDSYQRLAAAVVAYSAAVMLVWLNFAVDATYWVPYTFIESDKLVGLSMCGEGTTGWGEIDRCQGVSRLR